MFANIKKYIENSFTSISSSRKESKMEVYASVDEFKFHDAFEEDSTNGLFLNDVYIPEEILMKILSLVPPEQLLPLTLVCKKWCNIIKSEMLWKDIYNQENPHTNKWLPWYVYYVFCTTNAFKNMLKNGNGKEKFKHWKIIKNFGDQFVIEKEPQGAKPLPSNIPEFNGEKSCFATSYLECVKIQEIQLKNRRLLRYILNKYVKLQEIQLKNRRLLRYILNKHKPHLYASEWVAARFDCGSKYFLKFKGLAQELEQVAKSTNDYDNYMNDEYGDEESSNVKLLFQDEREKTMQQWGEGNWEKIEIVIDDYPDNIMSLIFEHEGVDTRFWKGHYGSKMAGGVVKLLIDTIKTEELLKTE